MMRHLTCDPHVENIGATVLAFAVNLADYLTKPVMEKHGLLDVKPDEWFSTQQGLNALNEIGQAPDFTAALVAAGIEVGKMVPVPGENPSFPDVLMSWNAVYQSMHRNGDVGQIKCEKIDEKHYKVTFTDLYPDDFGYGIMYGYAQRFLPPGTDFSVYFDPDVTPRDRGGDKGYTVIHADWK